MEIRVNDLLELKKPHPCGSHRFSVLRTGADIKIRCCGCAREVMVPRGKLEPRIKQITRE
ncbi:MAG: DUF951 domain-containing protein [Clostridia bacterium]|nr:DUF951 domain-containing protein [Clostridia bacterium]